MVFRMLVQNIFLAIGIICIFKFLELKNTYTLLSTWKKGLPIFDGDGIGFTFLGIYLSDDAIQFSEINSVANIFLIIGIIIIIVAIAMLIMNVKKKV